jgi:hypothetical protein
MNNGNIILVIYKGIIYPPNPRMQPTWPSTWGQGA